MEWWKALLLPEPDAADPVRFWGRAALYLFLVLWGLRFLFSTVPDNYAGRSFMHMINLPFQIGYDTFPLRFSTDISPTREVADHE
ncbi:MAG TPA: hypothetical protein VLQ45_32800 [Thermoanaerobaculia bacterium]|nr:hypothetical protein [Thermoanaerobaculia bacterium]